MPALTARRQPYKRAVNGGAASHPVYRSFTAMKGRCFNPSNSRYESHGARGITVCARWMEPQGFWHFVEDMGPRPSRRHSLDRIDNDGNYEPSNCRWATPLEQAGNTRRVRGHAGVTFNKRARLWAARIMINRVNHYLGYYRTEAEAVMARQEAEARLGV